MKKLLFVFPIVVLLAAGCNSNSKSASQTNNQQAQQPVTQVQSSLVTPDAPALTYYPAVNNEKPFIQITWDYSVAPAFNIYRSSDVNTMNSQWDKINKEPYPQSAHAAVDYDFPDAHTLYYRITSLDGKGNESSSSPTATISLDQTSNWKIYTNSKYGYSIQYPNDWYIFTDSASNNIFCGGPRNTDCYGGTLDIANVSNLSDYNGSHDQPQKTPPANFAVLELSIFPTNSTMRNSSTTFCNSPSETNPVIKNITINGLSGQNCTAYGNDMPTGNIKVTYINGQTYQYAFNYRPNSMENLGSLPANVVEAMDAMVNSFSAK